MENNTHTYYVLKIRLRRREAHPHEEGKKPYDTKKPGPNIKSDISATRQST